MTDRKPAESVGSRIVRASLVVGVAHALFKVAGLIQATVAKRYIDNNTFDIVYVMIFEGFIFSLFLIGEEVIIPATMPVFKAEKDLHGEGPAWALINVFVTLQAIVLCIVVALLVCFPEVFIVLLTPWTRAGQPETMDLARFALVWLAPMLFGLSLGSTSYLLLNSYERFFLAAFGDASLKIMVIIFLVVGIVGLDLDYRVLVFGLLFGSVAKLLTHLIGLLRELRHFRPSLALRNPALKTVGLLMLPLILGIVYAKCRDFYNNQYVLALIDVPGMLTANSFGRKLFMAISWMVPYAVSIAMLPYFCELVDRQDRKQLGRVISDAIRIMLVFFMPAAVVLALLSEPIAMVLFRGGEFTAETVRWAALSNACYSLVLPAFALEYILMQAYFANRKVWSVTAIGVFSSTISVFLSWLFIVHLGIRGTDALIVVALGYTIARTVKTVILIVILNRSLPLLGDRGLVVFAGKLIVLTAAVGAGTWLGLHGFESAVSAGHGKVVLFAKCVASGLMAALAFFGVVFALRLREPWTMWQWALEKVRRRRGG